jgi:hypothetical protein
MCSVRSFLVQHFGNGDDELALHVWEWAMRAQDAVSHDSDPPSNCARCKDQLGAYFLVGDSGQCRPRPHPRMSARAFKFVHTRLVTLHHITLHHITFCFVQPTIYTFCAMGNGLSCAEL